ncbi:Protein of unknown function DUF1394 [Cinara cedri]|uniref:CYRIA/CYRIB Rac1 binding domain-containing protein n=1 Tax=Cinara cedri TaxID=506608 RepID=A0A5E4NEF0_9HEMI|nr:Protein of unknown function DUF1394 [Cinara cedri]
MGKLLSLLLREDSCCSAQHKYDVFLDFENVQPTASELELFDDVQIVLTEASDVLSDLKNYSGADQHIRAAIINPSAEQNASTWEELIPRIRKLRRFYFFSQKIAFVVPQILNSICSDDITPSHQLERQQAIVKQFSEIIDFVFKFDEYKMQTPAIQNDFSYYRRVLMREGPSSYSTDLDDDSTSNLNIANKVSLFYAESTPMLRTLTNVTSQFLNTDKRLVDYAIEMLSTMVKVCIRMLETPAVQFKKRETHLFMLRVLVGLIILCDHVYPNGVFVKTSNIDIKGCIRLLKEQPEEIHTENLLNALRYTTVHLNDSSTSKTIKTLLMEA